MAVTRVGPDHNAELARILLLGGDNPQGRDLHCWGSPHAAVVQELSELDHVAAVVDGCDAVMLLDVAPEPRRAWAWGPAVLTGDRQRRADAMLAALVEAVRGDVDRISAFPTLGSWLEAWWRSRGAQPGAQVFVYGRPAGTLPEPDGRVRLMVPADAQTVGALHDRSFPSTYITPAELVAPEALHRVWVAERAGQVAGYLCSEVGADDTGTVHFVAVDSAHRGQGLGGALLRTAVHGLGEREVNLTVAVCNPAQALYAKAGFAQVAVGQPFDLYL